MKRGAIRHPKIYALADALGVRRAEAIGVLHALYEFTAEQRPDGNIGGILGSYLAEQCLWHGDGNVLIDALVACRLVDKLATETKPAPTLKRKSAQPVLFRVRKRAQTRARVLYVHDWHEHAESSVHNKLARARQWFANGKPPKLNRLDKVERPLAEEFYRTHGARPANARRTPAERPACTPLTLPKPKPIREEKNSVRKRRAHVKAQAPPAPATNDQPTSLSDSGKLPLPPSVSDSGSENKTPTPRELAEDLARRMGLHPRGGQHKQFETDCRCLVLIASRVLLGQTGPVPEGVKDVRAKADELATSGVQNRMAAFTAWFKQRLKDNGHEWKRGGVGTGIGEVMAGLKAGDA